MNRKRLAGVLSSVSGIILISTFCGWTAEGPTIPPTVDRIWPVGMKRGTTATFTIDGRNLTNPRPVLFDTKGITAKVMLAEPMVGQHALAIVGRVRHSVSPGLAATRRLCAAERVTPRTRSAPQSLRVAANRYRGAVRRGKQTTFNCG